MCIREGDRLSVLFVTNVRMSVFKAVRERLCLDELDHIARLANYIRDYQAAVELDRVLPKAEVKEIDAFLDELEEQGVLEVVEND